MAGPYHIVELLARGGMGDVYRATDMRLQRDVALKHMSAAGIDDPQRTERFLQEARVTAALDHANIVKVFDVGVLGGRPYLVEEFLEGETLRARLRNGPLTTSEACRIAGEVAAGLVVAHAAGLVHRDLKPDNIFLTRAGVTKILDFGIAKTAGTGDPVVADGLATLTGVLLGTAGYLAPEQIRGGPVDGRADLFALGSMLFEMISGQRAFAREHTIDTLHAILHDDPPALPSQSAVPDDLDAVVARLLQKAPAARFQSAADLAWVLAHMPQPVDAAAHRACRRRREHGGPGSRSISRLPGRCATLRAGRGRDWRMGDACTTCRSRIAARDGHAADQRPVARHLARRAEDCLRRPIGWTASTVGARAGRSGGAATSRAPSAHRLLSGRRTADRSVSSRMRG